MSAIVSARAQKLEGTVSSRAVAVFTRVPMVGLTIVLVLIAFRYLTNPVQAAAAAGISFTSPGGITVARVGFAALPLAFAVFFLGCLFSPRRLLSGLRTEVMLLAIVIGVRVLAMALAHSAETAALLVPETVMAALCFFAIRIETERLKRGQSALAS